MSRMKWITAIPIVAGIMILMLAGCSGGEGPFSPDSQSDDFSGARDVLAAFADACIAQDIDLAAGYLANPEDAPRLELVREILPYLGRALDEAVVSEGGSDCMEVDFRLQHPDDPSGRQIESRLYVVGNEESGDWAISFARPDRPVQAPDETERDAQWGSPAHNSLSGYIVEYYKQHYTSDTEFQKVLNSWLGGLFADAIALGSVMEDLEAPFPNRASCHITSPAQQLSLPTSSSDFIKKWDDSVSPPAIAELNIFEWGFGQGTQLGVENDFTFQLAIERYKNAKTKLDLLYSFYTLGFTMHLLEDMTCPAHARNDDHGLLQGDPFENWAGILRQDSGLIDESDELFESLPAPDDGFTDSELLGYFRDLAESSTGEVYADYPGVASLLWYTCWMTNHMCFSEDTIMENTNSMGYVDTISYPKLTSWHEEGSDAYFMGEPGEEQLEAMIELGIVPEGTTEYKVGVGSGWWDLWLFYYRITHWFQDPDVDDIIEAHQGAWDLITVNDGNDEDYFRNGTLGVREQQYRLEFALIVQAGAALIHEFYLETR